MKELSPERWRHIDTLFEKALEKPAGDRYSYIKQICGNDPELYSELKKLLEIHEEAGRILGDSVTEFASPLLPGLTTQLETEREKKDDPDFTDLQPGAIIGSYVIREKIGRGGMGDIYIARRADNLYEKDIAIKVMRAGLDSRDILRRFESERKILASLEHPNIARLYDGGISREERPWFVMEYVEGMPIDEYCDFHKLSVSKRIELFLTVCNAVGYAHQNLIVHRDLKPSNILVTPDGSIKLLDFGIAKILSDEPADSDSSVTRIGERFLSPNYASPEQLANEKITTASDVFSLGVVLYKLLTGRRPFRRRYPFTDQKQTDKVPEYPSKVVKNGSRRNCRNRSATQSELTRTLKGDLDAIVMMALRNEPDRRYGSADQFIDDLQRYMQNLPVRAQTESIGYRLKKFIIRHKTGFGASVLAVILSVGFTVALILQQAQTAKERNLALTERDKATEIAGFLEDLFAAGDPAFGTTRADTLQLKEFIKIGTERIHQELESQPVVQAQMFNVLGNVNRKLGLFDESRLLLEKALEMRSDLFKEDHPEIAESMNNMGEYYYDTGDYETATPYLQNALEMRLRLFGKHHKDVAKSYTSLANLVHSNGDYDKAESLYRQAYEINLELNGEVNRSTAISITNLATILQRKGNLDEAERLHHQALEIYQQLLSDEHPLIATSSNNLALLLIERGDFEQAEPYSRRALDLRRKIYGDQHPQTLNSLNNLATLLADLENYKEAEELYKRSLELRKNQFGYQSRAVFVTLNNLADLMKKTGDYETAIPLFNEAIQIAVNVLGDEHPSVGILSANLAAALRLAGSVNEAEEIYRSSVDLLSRQLSHDHPSLARAKIGLGNCLTDLGRYDDAERLILEGYVTLSENGSNTTVGLEALVDLYETWEKNGELIKYRELLAGREKLADK